MGRWECRGCADGISGASLVMMRQMQFSLLALVILLSCSYGCAGSLDDDVDGGIYVSSSTGDDATPVADGGGSRALPFQSLDHALTVCSVTPSQGCHIILMEGVYAITHEVALANAAVSITGAGDASPVSLLAGRSDARGIEEQGALQILATSSVEMRNLRIINVQRKVFSIVPQDGQSRADQVSFVDVTMSAARDCSDDVTYTEIQARIVKMTRVRILGVVGRPFVLERIEGLELIECEFECSRGSSVQVSEWFTTHGTSFVGTKMKEADSCSMLRVVAVDNHHDIGLPIVLSNSSFSQGRGWTEEGCVGGALALVVEERFCNITIRDSQFTGNRARGGGALAITSTFPETEGCSGREPRIHISGCRFDGNAGRHAAAIFLDYTASAVIEDCEFERNEAVTAAAIMSAYGASITMSRCTLRENVARSAECPLFDIGAEHRSGFKQELLIGEDVLVDGEPYNRHDLTSCLWMNCCSSCETESGGAEEDRSEHIELTITFILAVGVLSFLFVGFVVVFILGIRARAAERAERIRMEMRDAESSESLLDDQEEL